MSGPGPAKATLKGMLKFTGATGAVIYQEGCFGSASSNPAATGTGGNSVTHNGAGSWTIQLDPGQDPTRTLLSGGIDAVGATGTNEFQMTQTSATAVDIRTFSGGVATDKNCWLRVEGLDVPST